MQVYTLDEVPRDLGATSLALGLFDGVHAGHLALLARVREEAEKRGISPSVLTFDDDPALKAGTPRLTRHGPVISHEKMSSSHPWERTAAAPPAGSPPGDLGASHPCLGPSRTAASGRPTTSKLGRPRAISVSTCTGQALSPNRPALVTLAYIFFSSGRSFSGRQAADSTSIVLRSGGKSKQKSKKDMLFESTSPRDYFAPSRSIRSSQVEAISSA